MEQLEKYKVLWVDDDNTIVNSTKSIARLHGIKFEHFENWESAKKELQDNFDEYSAIVLDGRCKVKSGNDEIEEESFLNKIIPMLTHIFGRKQRSIPWYVYSAGAKALQHFDDVMKQIGYIREEEDWGNMVYIKASPDENINLHGLCKTICEVASKHKESTIKKRYNHVFKYIGKDGIIDKNDINHVYNIMLDALCAWHFPEIRGDYKYSGNDLRIVLESIIDTAYFQNILPEECYNSYSKLADSCKYLTGKESCGVRYGEHEDCIFPKYMGYIANSIRIATSLDSHSKDKIDKDKFNFENKECLYFGYVLLLCDMIKWFGDLVSNKNELEIIKKNVEKSKKKDDLIVKDDLSVWKGKLCSIECDMAGNVYGVSENQLFKVKKEAEDDIGKQVEIVKVLENTRVQKDKYSLFLANYKVIE